MGVSERKYKIDRTQGSLTLQREYSFVTIVISKESVDLILTFSFKIIRSVSKKSDSIIWREM